MTLKDINLKKTYSSDFDDILHDFYIPALESSKQYDRIAGFFSSSTLAIAARGILGLIKNGGIMKLIVSPRLSKKDLEIIVSSSKEPEKYIEEKMLEELDKLEDKFVRDHVLALGWMIANKKLEIKVAVVYDNKGSILSSENIQAEGIFHQKVGILKDSMGNTITFSGSVNETRGGWLNNIEEFKVFRSWNSSEDEYIRPDILKFDRFWNDQAERAKVIDIPSAVKNKFIQIAPRDIEKVNLEKWSRSLERKSRRKPFKHQNDAVEAFRKSNMNGIFKMATGTGKTYTALLSLEQYFRDKKRYGNRILIIVPQHGLVEQWVNDLREFFSTKDFVLSYDSKTTEKDKIDVRKFWKYKFHDGDNFNIFLVITVDSINNFTPFKSYVPNFIIGDEVHSYGTENRMITLKNSLGHPEYILGLSATPERYYDLDGTERLLNYFGSIIYEYELKSAQKDGVLSKYNYYPFLVELTPEEEKQVEDLTKRIGKAIAIDFKNEISEKERQMPASAKRLVQERAKKIKKAEDKLNALKIILENNKEKLKQCIIYCEDNKQLDAAQRVFDDLKIDSYVKYHSKTLNREEALDIFKKKKCNFILSMHCLDQGVDIPSCESLIILSSSGNPREYIQRRGRVLRNPLGKIKPVVKIFDILAFPRNTEETYRGIVMTQLIRAWEFISCSQSPEEKMKLMEIMNCYDIHSAELDKIILEW